MTATLVDRVSGHRFLSGLAPEHRAALAADASVSSFIAGVRLFAEGAVADRFWLLESGAVALDVPVPGRGDVVVETLAGPTVLGWSWLYLPYRWHFGAVAREPSTALAFDAESVRRRCARDPVFGYAMMNLFAPVIIQRLQATRLRMLDLYAPRPTP
jgi:CRP-like cAMP-binding protein